MVRSSESTPPWTLVRITKLTMQTSQHGIPYCSIWRIEQKKVVCKSHNVIGNNKHLQIKNKFPVEVIIDLYLIIYIYIGHTN